MQAVEQRLSYSGCRGAGYRERQSDEKITKKLKKLLKNLLTNGKRCDIIVGHFRTGSKRLRKVLEKSLKNFSKTS